MPPLLTNPELVPVGMNLRVTRNNAKVTLQTAATALGTSGVTISRLERGNQHNSELARRYEEWLENAS
jgi:transcriptional regulator with XRE-family HTH domain